MKKIFSILILSVLVLSSCGTKKFEELPTEKKDEIVKLIEEKREAMIEKIDMSLYSNEANLTEENLAKLRTQIEEINKNVIEEVKKIEGVDLTEIENRLNAQDVKEIIKK